MRHEQSVPEASYIVANCNETAGPTLKPCIKQSVYAMLVTADGREFFGANWMTNGDVTICPRVERNCASGTGYELCQTVCNQEFHAERFALDACINEHCDPEGSTVWVTGHTYCCDGCITAMQNAGVARAVVLDSGKVYQF